MVLYRKPFDGSLKMAMGLATFAADKGKEGDRKYLSPPEWRISNTRIGVSQLDRSLIETFYTYIL